jgi:hypothetical protein
VESLLHEYLSKVDSPEMHSRFWADDLVYVGAGGKVRTKAEIVNSVTEEAERSKANAAEAKKEGAAGSYDAEDVKTRQFGNVVVLNFRLVAHGEDGKPMYFRNSGTFVERNGKWQAVSWQATKESADAPVAASSEDKKPDGKK